MGGVPVLKKSLMVGAATVMVLAVTYAVAAMRSSRVNRHIMHPMQAA